MMVSVVMVVMMVMSVRAVVLFNVAMLLVAMLSLCLGLEGNVGNSVLTKLCTHRILNGVSITRYDYMHRCVVASSVHAPHVDMMYVKHALNLAHVLAYLINRDSLGRSLKEERQHLGKISHRIYENKDSHAYRHYWVDEREIGKSHNDSAHKHHKPAKHILEHMKIYRLLTEGALSVCKECRCEIYKHTDNGKNYHFYCAVNDQNERFIAVATS